MHRPRLPGTIDLETPGHFLEPVHQDGDKDAAIVGYVEHHPSVDPARRGADCCGYISIRQADAHPVWAIEAGTPEAPETLSPSILCRTCGAHGWVREKRWIPA